MSPKITICLPHWQVLSLVKICLRSIRKHSRQYDIEVIVVDNGSKDESLHWLRSLEWIKLIERLEEGPYNFPNNVFSAWNLGLQHATGEFFVTMHTDVFVKSDNWLNRYLEAFHSGGPNVVAVGGWKLGVESAMYRFQKEAVGLLVDHTKKFFGLRVHHKTQLKKYPRDYCAMYRRSALLQHKMDFGTLHGKGGGYRTAMQIWDQGYDVKLIPLAEMHKLMAHIAHGTAGLAADASFKLSRAAEQAKASRRVAQIFKESWIQELVADTNLDR